MMTETANRDGDATTVVRKRIRPPKCLDAYVDDGILSREDVASARLLVELADLTDPPQDAAWVAMCLAIRAPRDSHTCVDLASIPYLPGRAESPVTPPPPSWPANVDDWKRALATAGALVSSSESRGPFAIDGNRLYLARSLREENDIARRLRGGGEDAVNVTILLGGPGTGKTTEVARQLIERFRSAPQTQIALAAPTGKAAARMAEALRQRLRELAGNEQSQAAPGAITSAEDASMASAEVRAAVEAVRPVTIHKLLGYRPHGTPRFKFRDDNRLVCDLVVLDETSMLSSSLMLHLLEALRPGTELLLVGDPDQLVSVDAGSVLGDIARAAQAARRLGLPPATPTKTLTVRYRFGPQIGALADAILTAEADLAMKILAGTIVPQPDPGNSIANDPKSVRWVVPSSREFRDVVDEVVAHARRVQDAVKEGPATALAEQRKLQVLCAHKAGRLGVSGWNELVEQRLHVAGGRAWYTGRPIMITKNNPAIGLFNGDVGVVVPVDPGEDRGDRVRMDAAFPDTGVPRRVPVSRLEEVITVYALTIHKSQGSEYDHVVVVLPEHPSRIVTRELLYTAVTRASRRVTLVATEEVIRTAIATPIRRATGLSERLA